MIRTLTLAVVLLAFSARPAHATPFTVVVGDADWFGSNSVVSELGLWPVPIFDTLTLLDNRSAGEASATNGAQLTDLYSAISNPAWCDPGEENTPQCSPNGGAGTFVLPFFGVLQSASLGMMLGDFQCSSFGAITVTVNGVNQAFCYDQGYQMGGFNAFALTAPMLAAANSIGQVEMTIQVGGSLDYIAFDFVRLFGDTDLTQSFDPVVPEPGTLALLGTGMVIVWGGARRRARAKKA